VSGRLGNSARAFSFAASAVLLIGVALIAGGVGPWTARPLTNRSPDTRPVTVPTITLPTRTRAGASPEGEAPPALKWGLQVLLIAVFAFAVTLLARFLYRKFTELTSEREESVGGREQLPATVGLAQPQPPPVRNRESGRDFDPRAAADAIISCWLWVETAAAAAGSGRRKADTPTEFLHRFVGRRQESSVASESAARTWAAAEVLLPLYQRARFDRVALTEDAAVCARAAAQTLCGGVRRAPSAPPAAQAGPAR
jgi:hypothetical protein